MRHHRSRRPPRPPRRRPPAVPHLARALADRDAPVGEFAAAALVDLGAHDLVDAWCAASTPTPNACASLREASRAVASLDPVGLWSGRRTAWVDRAVEQRAVTLRLRRDGPALAGELCVEAHGCVALDRVEFTGARLALAYTRPGGPESVVLRLDVAGAHGTGAPAGCPRDVRPAPASNCLPAGFALQRL